MDFIALHVSDVPSSAGRAAVGAVAGLLAAVVANVPMRRLPEGTTPPFIVTGALTGEALADVDPKLASGVHYAGGVLVGALFTLLAVGLEGILPFTAALVGVGLRLVPHLLATLATFALLVALFAYGIFPLFGKEAKAAAKRVRHDWVVSSAVYSAALSVFVVLIVASL